MLKHIRKSFIAFTVVSSLAFFSGCGIDNDGENVLSGKNKFVGAQIIDDINTSVMLQVVQGSIDSSAQNAFGYKAVKITYNTENEDGEEVVASGLLVIPTASDAYQTYLASVGKAFSVSMICENHGTIFTNDEAPSVAEKANGLPENPTAVLMSGYAGFAAVIPDYIGYGESDDTVHPYMLKEASAEASLDMIKASIYYMEQNGIALNYQLYISGYSQGGYTAMALAQKVENEFSTVNLMGVAPMAGPYNLVSLANIELDASHTMVYPAFLGYLASSYSYYYDDLNISDLVLYPDPVSYNNLFDGSKTNVEIHINLGLTDYPADPLTDYGFMTHTADELFKDSLITDYKSNINTGKEFKDELVKNSTYNWTPKTKVNLIHCIDDEIIPFSISQDTYDLMVANGAQNMTLSPIPSSLLPGDEAFIHADCATTAYGAAVQWFDGIRQGNI